MRLLLEFLHEKKPLSHNEISVVFLGPRRMSRINFTYLGHSGPTDVITFRHGEILICPQVVAAQSRLFGTTYTEELFLYIIHGWLHLWGMNDKHPAQARKMARAQNTLLQKFLRYSSFRSSKLLK